MKLYWLIFTDVGNHSWEHHYVMAASEKAAISYIMDKESGGRPNRPFTITEHDEGDVLTEVY